ncbi:MAG: hypothetical protein JW940_25020 [Polyangiaceae bacterium]|nr:hypothetical protein [Polyangiaceae bacterium]
MPLDAKRKPSRQSGFESWYPYYAGFTEEFARGVLVELGGGRSLTVLDPWNGSGTTTRIAYEMGHRAIGLDLNPVANLVATAKLVHPEDALHVPGFTRRLASAKPVGVRPSDPLLLWMAPSVAEQYRAMEAAILNELGTTSSGAVADLRTESIPPLAAFMLLALVRAAREAASLRDVTNPTWTMPGEGRRKAIRTLGTRWQAHVARMAEELAARRTVLSRSAWLGQIRTADARALPIRAEQVDVVLTSPPYCTRIDYVVSSSFELAALGIGSNSAEFERLRLATMGTPLARRGEPPEIPRAWPADIRSLLASIRAHPSKASRSYYYKTFWQYFADARAALAELNRVLRVGGLAVFVLQTSFYKEICVDLPALYVGLARSLGFNGVVVGAARVQRALAQIHPHSVHHRRESLYREAVVALEKAA